MTVLYWVFIGIIAVAVLFGLKDLLSFVFGTWAENGGKFALLLGIFIILLITPSIVKWVNPQYYGISIWVFILYCVALVIFRLTKTNSSEHKEG